MKLSQAQRDQIRAGGAPRLTFPPDKPCPLKEGDVIPVASHLELVITRIRRSRKGEYVAVYMIRDHRVQLMRRVPPMFEAPELDSQGYPVPPDKEAIAKARMEGAITSSPALAVPGDGGEVVPGEYQTVVAIQARARHAENRRNEQAQAEAAADMRRIKSEMNELVKRAVKMGIPPTQVLGPIAREIQAQHSDLQSAA